MALIGAIDDATGEVLGALFRDQEDTEGYFNVLEEIVSNYGIPEAVYRDGHAVFEVPEDEPLTIEEQLDGGRKLTQFGRLLEELDINSIRSRSPQAIGRVERLWGTLQDRLVSELRLAKAGNMVEANEILRKCLPIHNKKFAVPPAQPESAFRKPGRDWKDKFYLKYRRTVGLDNVVRCGPHRLQILPNGRYSYAKAKVVVCESFKGEQAVFYQGHRLQTRPAPQEAAQLRGMVTYKSPRQPAKPTPDHPWRRWVYRHHLDRG